MRKEIIDREKSKDMSHLRGLFPYVTRYRKYIFLALLFLVLGAATTLYFPVALRHVIDLGFAEGQHEKIAQYFWIMFAVSILMAVFTSLRYYWVSWLGQRVVTDIRKDVFDRVVGMSPAFFETTRTGEILSRINTDTTLVESVVGSTFSIALRSIVMLIGSMIMMIITSPKLAGMILLLIPVIIVPIILFGRKVRVLSKQSQDRIADSSALATETIYAIHTVQSYAQNERENQRFSESVLQAFTTSVKRIAAATSMSMAVVIMVLGGIIFVLWLGAQAVIEGTMTAGTLSQFLLYAIIAASTAGGLTAVWGELQRAAGALERITELLNMQSDIQSPEDAHIFTEKVKGNIALEDVTFAYPSRLDQPVLEAISLNIKAGETVALVGPSGAGKTTMFQLLMRFYDPQQGLIKIDDVALTALELGSLRQQMALVSQDVTIFSTNALENIRYGRPDASDEQVYAAAKAAHADVFIDDLAEQYDTFLGERGVRLSGGQAQRLSIARALLTDPPILLLDEATSALDARSEKLVQQALDELMRDRTTLVIAHRLATVRKADRIVVMNEGRVVAEGSHEELIESNELYRSLAELQFLV
ncbi:MAG: ATP-binding cassette domain-containing protein [Xanthomonadales bacterium]|nr:ATP-binding cassette domain-containing protein [Xanthomonadales bacterium]